MTSWRLARRSLPLDGKTLVMGILNVTPDSFSDGGRHASAGPAVEHALRMEAEGADIIDIGAESTRPGAAPVDPAEELRRLRPILEALRGQLSAPISVDTRRAAVAQQALGLGAEIVNDVSALGDPGMAPAVANARAGVVLMHMRGEPSTMQKDPRYDDVVREVADFLLDRAKAAERAGIARDAIVLDPGLGFGKRSGGGAEDNAALLKHLGSITRLGWPVLVGASRKTFIGNASGGLPVGERLEGSLAAAVLAATGGARVVRAHDVKATRRALDVADMVRRA